jgi:NhaA family Na+:H+ antiporter
VTALRQSLADPVVVGIVVGLAAGKPIGVFAATWLVARFTRAELDQDLAWIDVLGLALLAGIGFTVSLLIGELAYGTSTPRGDQVKLAVLAATVLAACLAAIVLTARNRAYRRISEDESRDDDRDGIPDVYTSIEMP